MLLLLLFLCAFPVATAFGNRRLSAYICHADPYILADGAAVPRAGKTFDDAYGEYVDARQDPSGNGTRLWRAMPDCLQPRAFSVRANRSRLPEAVRWIETKCQGECIVYSVYPVVNARFKTVYLS